MALRQIETFVPTDRRAVAAEAIGTDVIAVWYEPLMGNQVLIRALVQAEHVEAITDRLEKKFSAVEGFRVVVLPAEATIPRPPEEKRPPPPDEALAEPAPIVGRISREELYQDISQSAALSASYLVMVALSAVVAAIGVIYDSTTVVIGAMVIAPLLGPNVALSLATALGDGGLAVRAARTNISGVAVALAAALAVGFIVPVNPGVHEIQARLSAHGKDIVLALASGCAGTLAFTTGAPAALIGVMVAVALIPPLVTFGVLAGARQFDLGLGALLLFSANVICVNLAGVVTFVAQGIRPLTWWQADRARRAVRLAVGLWLLMLGLLVVVILTIHQRG
jgi:uncharacterized hydrophobic protein (TIGR00341 family)